MGMQATLQSPAVVDSASRRRRRNSDSIDIRDVSTNRNLLYGTFISLRFAYETFCVASAPETCAFSPGDVVYSDLVRRVNSAIATYRIVEPPCWSLEAGWDIPCLQAAARDAVAQGERQTKS